MKSLSGGTVGNWKQWVMCTVLRACGITLPGLACRKLMPTRKTSVKAVK